MADLTPDEVMAMHVAEESIDEWARGQCRTCSGNDRSHFSIAVEFPCDAYRMAERAKTEAEARKTAEARVTALEAVVRDFIAAPNFYLAGNNTEGYLQFCALCNEQEHKGTCPFRRAVELMEGEE